MSTSKNVVFDVVGTLVGYDHLFAAINARLGDRLRAEGIKPSLLGYTWIEVAEREYTYLSMSGAYKPFGTVFEALFYRTLWMAGIAEPRVWASAEDLEYIMGQYVGLKLRPGAAECVQKLRDAGFTVWCFTAGELQRVGGYFAQAGVDMPAENLISCDERGIGKPDPEAYRPVLEKLVAENEGKTPWFAAGHMWDVAAARRAGFRGAYSSIWEKEPLTELFGDMDVIDDTLPGMADKIIAHHASHSVKAKTPALAPNSTTSFWRTNPHALDSYRSTEALPEECDIVVVGAGYAGVSVTHHILELTRSEGGAAAPSIVILEGRQACSGATGRNGGHLKPDSYNRIATLSDEFGIVAATEVAEFEARHVETLRQIVERENIDCDFTVVDAIDVQISESHARSLKDGYDRLVAAGCGPTRRTKYVGGKEAEAFSGVKGAVACFSYTAGHLWPYKLIMHLLEKAVRQGVNLQTHTQVTSIKEAATSTPHSWLVRTSRGTIRAKKVVVATNGYTSALLPQYRDKIVPVRGTCSRIVAPAGHTGPRLTRTYTIRHNEWNYDYLIPRSDGSIVVGGARPAFIDNPDSWYNVSDDSRVLESAVRYFDDYMQKHFVGWDESHAYTDRVWTGIMGYSSDGLPHVGPVPGHENQWIIGGFTGHGMPQIFLAAEGLAKMVVHGTEFKDTGLPRLFQTTQARLDETKMAISGSIFKPGAAPVAVAKL
ncbi:FAD dependent oxidoreductase-domain-containing protein [Aspergillus lucknowensis]|uniref:FAD dependent oxidoreductase-domain-containing protein n=1 Tax=Aspergillus lucknowensis TaxID=176173 RepID=A0ABR4M762_9EURO